MDACPPAGEDGGVSQMSSPAPSPADLAAACPADLRAELATVALDVATACARLVMRERPADLGVAATKSSATDVVTAMDTASERLAREVVARHRPGDGFHGEEGAATAGTTGITWVVDPIDGTVNYLYDHPGFCVSVAAVVGDPAAPHGYRPVASAVVAPRYREAYVAALGTGSRLVTLDDGLAPTGERALRAHPADDLATTLLATGFGYTARKREWQGSVVAGLLPLVRDIRRGGSAALDLCWAAAGRVDAYAEHGLNPWDAAGGWLVATEAGLVVTDLDGADPTPAWTIAAGESVAAKLRDAVVRLGGHEAPPA